MPNDATLPDGFLHDVFSKSSLSSSSDCADCGVGQRVDPLKGDSVGRNDGRLVGCACSLCGRERVECIENESD